MKKAVKLLALLLSFVVFLSISLVKAEPKTVKVELTLYNSVPTVNGNNALPLEHYPFIEKGRMMLPIRIYSEIFEINIDWETTTKTLTFTSTKNTLVMTVDSQIAYINGKEVFVDVPVYVPKKLARTFAPVRFIMETFEATVTWDPDLHKATIVYELPEE